MVVNYIKVSYRNLVKYKLYTLLNILGLSVGMASALFIAMYVIHEMSYDRYLPDAGEIYRIGLRGTLSGNTIDEAVTPAPMAGVIQDEFPRVRHVTRILPYTSLVRSEFQKFSEMNFYFADTSFFNVFSLPLLSGKPATALSKPFSVVITDATARLLFGSESPIGKTVQIENDTSWYTVTGVLHLPENTHFQFDCLASLSSLKWIDQKNWVVNYFYTYALVDKDYTGKQFETDINHTVIHKYLAPQVEKATGSSIDFFSKTGNRLSYFVQPILSIHLHSNLQYELGKNEHASNLLVFVFAGILLLLIAVINFMNLATARSATRAREVGMRKVVGAHQKQLMIQFVMESVFMSIIALILALVLVDLFTRSFQHLTGENVDLHMFLHAGFITGCLAVTVFIGVLAGSYPSFVMASYSPLKILKGNSENRHQSPRLRNILVITQFSVSIILMLWTFTLFRQLSFMKHFNMGFPKEQILVIKRSQGLNDNKEKFLEEIQKLPGVLGVSMATHIPGKTYMNNAFFPENKPNTAYLLNQSLVSPGFAQSLKLHMLQGRFLRASDTLGCVINKKAAVTLGFMHPVGKKIFQTVRNERLAFKIVGVVADFNFKSLRYPIGPMIMTLMENKFDGYILVRLDIRKATPLIKEFKRNWEEYSREYPFDYFWMDQDFDELYSSEQLMATVLLTFSAISMFIASLGLFGLIAFTSLKRTREIGIRKTMGATATEITVLLTRDSVLPVALSLLIAWPVATAINYYWLHTFTYHIRIYPVDYFYSAFIAIVISVLTVVVQAMKAARKNPSKAIKYE